MHDLNAIRSEDDLENLLSEPPAAVVETLGRLPGDLVLLGVAGKMGLSLARLAKRASDAAGVRRRVIGVSRFSSGDEGPFRACGVETIRCDLLDEKAVAELPAAPNVVAMIGMKFGSTGNESMTWAINCYLPAVICRRYRNSRIVAFSTGNVYGLTSATGSGSRETDALAPVGEYAMTAVGRERMYEHFSRALKIPLALIRLNYACDLRYGVLVDLARQVQAGAEIDLAMGYFNTIWQGDANAMTLRAFDHTASPAWVVNVTGPRTLPVRQVCERLGELLGKPPRFIGKEADTALLSDARRGVELLGPLRFTEDQLVEGVARWVSGGGRLLGKPTHFESREGKF